MRLQLKMLSKILLILFLQLMLVAFVLAANVNLDKLDIAKFTIAEGEEKTIQLNDEEFIITADLVLEREIRLSLQPSNLALTVKKEQIIDNVDINNDGELDFSISYLSNVDKTATLEIVKKGIETQLEEEKEEKEEKEEIPDVAQLSSALTQNLKFIVAAVIILIILILIFSRRKNSPEKFYNKAESLHREAQEFHEDGDDETANELYEKAEEFREKARELEKTGG